MHTEVLIPGARSDAGNAHQYTSGKVASSSFLSNTGRTVPAEICDQLVFVVETESFRWVAHYVNFIFVLFTIILLLPSWNVLAPSHHQQVFVAEFAEVESEVRYRHQHEIRCYLLLLPPLPRDAHRLGKGVH